MLRNADRKEGRKEGRKEKVEELDRKEGKYICRIEEREWLWKVLQA
jgi:hypothetical protein